MENLSVGLAVLPVVVSLSLILVTRKTVMSLLLGAMSGAVIIQWGGLRSLPSYLWAVLSDALMNPWHLSALGFTLLLGGFASLLEAGGGLQAFFSGVYTKRGVEGRAVGLGFLCFFDGLANSLLVGNLVRPIADRRGVPREKIAYIADTTSSTIACLAPISTWIAMQLGLISVVLAERGLEVSPYQLFLQSVPVNFYCVVSLSLLIGLTYLQKDFGAMAKVAVGDDEGVAVGYQCSRGEFVKALISVGFLLLSIPTLYYLFEVESVMPITFTKVVNAMGGGSGPAVFLWSSLLALTLTYGLTTQLTHGERGAAIWRGAKQVLGPLAVLVCAWLFGAVVRDLGLAVRLSDWVGGSVRFLPLLVFLGGCLLSFTTGTSWGTMALLFPLAFGAVGEMADADFLSMAPLLIGAVFSGAVFGDHCSPYSDTTIVSAVAAGCDPYAHVKTQLPYAVVSGALAAVLFLLGGLWSSAL